uniref:Uncharacterized protein LOC104242829 n=1 Tax=Nicotiana sylvestris TaxID=4096 RepID=A0A1U7YAF3_NICSY|nr:PREDICTED: uncharacterized protein LOC104242829 [Nicotiana sylvestris]
MDQGAGKRLKVKANKFKKKKELAKAPQDANKEHKAETCCFCNKERHYQNDCLKRKAWFERKGTISAFVCFESNLIEVPNNTWWLDSGATARVSTTLQGFLTIQSTNPNKDFLFMGNRMKAPIEGIGTYCLIMETGRHLDPLQTLYVPSASRNLISLSRLDVPGFDLMFGNGCSPGARVSFEPFKGRNARDGIFGVLLGLLGIGIGLFEGNSRSAEADLHAQMRDHRCGLQAQVHFRRCIDQIADAILAFQFFFYKFYHFLANARLQK